MSWSEVDCLTLESRNWPVELSVAYILLWDRRLKRSTSKDKLWKELARSSGPVATQRRCHIQEQKQRSEPHN